MPPLLSQPANDVELSNLRGPFYQDGCLSQLVEGGAACQSEGSSRSNGPDLLQCVAMLLFVFLDTMWLQELPSLAIPAMILAVPVQLWMVRVASRGSTMELVLEASLFMWLVSNSIWMCCEFLWDDPEPCGFLANIGFVERLSNDRWFYPFGLLIGVIIMFVTVAVLASFYVALAVASRRSRRSLALCSPPELTNGSAAHVFVLGLPRQVYRELYILPWLCSDMSWGFCNFLMSKKQPVGAIAPFCISCAGCAAAMLGLDSMRREVATRECSGALLNLSEVLWVLGNVCWALEDVWTDDTDTTARLVSLCLFVSGGILSVASSLCASRHS
eukprot:gb/GFBE01000598.1/.p1 GENE.gb/GFBE01000598.1/~~gb/GFBE01000598.1/.p1  ORF type:complete len:330 (+),score=55.87 gb/GFBE01000598.1/:1-990(+)